MGGDDEPGPPVGGGRVAQFRAVPAEYLLNEAERVLDIETAQERLPGAVHFACCGAGAGGPQPDRVRVTLAGQVIDGEPDEGALDDGQLAVVVLPAAAVFQPLVQPGPGHRSRGAVPGRVAGSAKASLCPCRGRRPPVEAGRAGRGGAGKYMTRSLRSRPVTSTGRPSRSHASRVRSETAR